jgi:hypothetical protein
MAELRWMAMRSKPATINPSKPQPTMLSAVTGQHA